MIPYGVVIPSSLRETINTSAKLLADEEEGRMRKLFDDYCAARGVEAVDSFPWPTDRVTAAWREVMGRQATVVGLRGRLADVIARSEEHTSELQSLMRISYAVFCLKKKTHTSSKTTI